MGVQMFQTFICLFCQPPDINLSFHSKVIMAAGHLLFALKSEEDFSDVVKALIRTLRSNTYARYTFFLRPFWCWTIKAFPKTLRKSVAKVTFKKGQRQSPSYQRQLSFVSFPRFTAKSKPWSCAASPIWPVGTRCCSNLTSSRSTCSPTTLSTWSGWSWIFSPSWSVRPTAPWYSGSSRWTTLSSPPRVSYVRSGTHLEAEGRVWNVYKGWWLLEFGRHTITILEAKGKGIHVSPRVSSHRWS